MIFPPLEIREIKDNRRVLSTDYAENDDNWLYTIKNIFDIYVKSELYEDDSAEI